MKRLLLLSTLFFAVQSWAKPLVVTTIRPMTMLVEAIAGDSVEIRQLLPDSEVPHHYSLRIADRALLAQSDLLLWVGPELESFLSKSVTALRPEKVITASELPNIQWLSPTPEGQAASRDPHIWMNPNNGRVIATEVANWLAAHYPGQREQILAAQQRFNQQLNVVKANTAAQLQALRQPNFIVDHDAFGHFGEAFNLHQSGALKTSTGLSSGARDLHQLLSQSEVHCIIAEPRHNHDRVEQLANKLKAKIAVIDPLGADIPMDSNAYLQLIATIGDNLTTCLSPTPVPVQP
ncbi:MAG: zinc ABC transporter substrate-binding protein [Gammaproteobacteria bacterium]|nr:zinc ABC transporter substrate-binding protein [Gammaproteobacteria bacterium]MBQ0840940.1 zinc ABC transporter substrate-binding protein [Gammaproteobacteria bacterium]